MVEKMGNDLMYWGDENAPNFRSLLRMAIVDPSTLTNMAFATKCRCQIIRTGFDDYDSVRFIGLELQLLFYFQFEES